MSPGVDRSTEGRFLEWCSALEKRHLSNVTFTEVRRSLQALSSIYVERRDRLSSGAALTGAGKRAAFALFYGPLHFLLTQRIVTESGAALQRLDRIVDLGCGTGAASAAWALGLPRSPRILGLDRSAWACDEASWTWRVLGLSGRTRRGDLSREPLRKGREGVLLAFVVNELDSPARARALQAAIRSSRYGGCVLVIEPIGRRPIPWWDEWSESFRDEGGREQLWRFPARLPERLQLLDRAAGLDHSELTGRSLYLPGRGGARMP